MFTAIACLITFAAGFGGAWWVRGRRAARALLAAENVSDDALCRLLDNEVREIRAETGRSQALLRDAVGKLHTSFSDMVQRTRQQGDTIVRLVEPGTGSPGVRRFAEAAGLLIRDLAAVVDDGGRDGVHIVQSMDSTVHSLDDLFLEVDALSHVAGREALERMRAPIRAARAALAQTRTLIEAGADRSMCAAIDATLKADALVADVHRINRALAEGMQAVADCSEHIRESVSLLVRSLQFEDITTQSLGVANAHLERLQDLGREASRLLSVESVTPDERLEALREFGVYLRLMREGSLRPVPKPVSQTDLVAGAVDLF